MVSTNIQVISAFAMIRRRRADQYTNSLCMCMCMALNMFKCVTPDLINPFLTVGIRRAMSSGFMRHVTALFILTETYNK